MTLTPTQTAERLRHLTKRYAHKLATLTLVEPEPLTDFVNKVTGGDAALSDPQLMRVIELYAEPETRSVTLARVAVTGL